MPRPAPVRSQKIKQAGIIIAISSYYEVKINYCKLTIVVIPSEFLLTVLAIFLSE